MDKELEKKIEEVNNLSPQESDTISNRKDIFSGISLAIQVIALLLFLIFVVGAYMKINILLQRIDESSFFTEITINGEKENKRIFFVAPIK